MNAIKRWSKDLIGLLFPDLCQACGTNLYHQERLICTRCFHSLPCTDYHLYQDNRVAKQFWGRVHLNAAMAMLYFRKHSKVQNLIHALKYNGQTEIGILLGALLGERLFMSEAYQNIDIILPVPLHQKKQRSRGYNQSSCIAKGVAQSLKVNFSEKILIKAVATSSQTRKSRYNRYENMQSVFQITGTEDVYGKHVMLVDDVITTGATLEACALLLLEAGAMKVSVATLAFTE